MTSNPVIDWEPTSAINHVECDLITLLKRDDLTESEKVAIRIAREAMQVAWNLAYDRKKAAEAAQSSEVASNGT
ncbi:hypothetical protein [Hyphomicrobium sp. DY-1]|uniref:hypothetical protein n=1 Tax=Hyphomicrobium sp. DY-1 TaxID=3075650 RepID=UPI0039C41EC4